VNYIGVLQSALTFEKGFKFLSATYYLVPVALLTSLLITRGAGLLRISKKLERGHKSDAEKE